MDEPVTGRITGIRELPGERFTVILESGEKLTISASAYLKFGLFTGKVLNSEEIEQIEAENLLSKIELGALRYLSIRSHTKKELKLKLLKKKFPASGIDTVLNKLESMGYINDENTAGYYVAELQRLKKEGKDLILSRLIKKGLSRQVISKTMEKVFSEEAETDNCRTLARKKYQMLRGKEKDEIKALKKLYDFLLGKGFSYELIKKVINELKTDSFPEFD
ncbi:MAG: RecX family transcriptional regulator [Ignavibacteriaceae bacterium]|nr:RecX family transcriptional regulator [Ignavibacteriaceae bacterium]